MSTILAPIVHPRFTLVHGDCIESMALMPRWSAGMVITSPPFADLFIYSRDVADLGNNREGGAFNLAFRMWCEQLARVVAPGRIVVLHTTQLRAYKILHDFIGLRDFCGAVVKGFV